MEGCQRWYDLAVERGLRPLLFDSNGDGGYHLLVVFDGPVATERVYRFGKSLVRNWKDLGLVKEPETFPKQKESNRDDTVISSAFPGDTTPGSTTLESGDGSSWLEGGAAVRAILATTGAPGDTIPATPIPPRVAKIEKRAEAGPWQAGRRPRPRCAAGRGGAVPPQAPGRQLRRLASGRHEPDRARRRGSGSLG